MAAFFFLPEKQKRRNRGSSWYISLHRPGPTLSSLKLFCHLPPGLISLSHLPLLSVCRRSAFLSLDLSVCQGDPSSAESLFLSIWISLSLQGTLDPVISITSPHPCPPHNTQLPPLLLVHLWLYRQDHPSVSLSLSRTETAILTHKGVLHCICPLVSCICLLHHVVHSSFFFFLSIHPSVSVCLNPNTSLSAVWVSKTMC